MLTTSDLILYIPVCTKTTPEEGEVIWESFEQFFDQLTVTGSNSLTVKLLTDVNFKIFFKNVLFGKAFRFFITWT